MKNTYTVVTTDITSGRTRNHGGIIGKTEAESIARMWRSRQYLATVVKEPAK